MFQQPIMIATVMFFDPVNFPWAPDSVYNPQGGKLGRPDYYRVLMDTYNIRYSLIIGPTSDYNTDNRCLLNTLKHGEDRFKGIAVVPWTISSETLADFKKHGIVGIALNVTMLAVEPFLLLDGLMAKLEELDLYAQIQVQNDQLLAFTFIEDLHENNHRSCRSTGCKGRNKTACVPSITVAG